MAKRAADEDVADDGDVEHDPLDVGAFIRSQRELAKRSIRRLAELADVSNPYLSQIEYREWDRCGHYPWLERSIYEEFFEVLRTWLRDTMGTR